MLDFFKDLADLMYAIDDEVLYDVSILPTEDNNCVHIITCIPINYDFSLLEEKHRVKIKNIVDSGLTDLTDQYSYEVKSTDEVFVPKTIHGTLPYAIECLSFFLSRHHLLANKESKKYTVATHNEVLSFPGLEFDPNLVGTVIPDQIQTLVQLLSLNQPQYNYISENLEPHPTRVSISLTKTVTVVREIIANLLYMEVPAIYGAVSS